MERSEHHTQIKSQTNAHPHHIHPPLCLRDLDATNRITEENQSRGNEMLRLLPISYKDHIRNEIVCNKIQAAIGPYEDILTTVEKTKLRWFGHVIRSSGLCKKIIQGTVIGKRKGRHKKRLEDNIREWTGLDFNSSQRAAKCRQRWQKIVADVSSGAPTTLVVPVSRIEFTLKSSVYWPIIGLGTRT